MEKSVVFIVLYTYIVFSIRKFKNEINSYHFKLENMLYDKIRLNIFVF